MRWTTLIAMSMLWMVGLTGCKKSKKSVTCIRRTMCYSAKEDIKLKDEKRTYEAENVIPYLVEQGWNTGASAGQIIPLIVGEPDVAVRLSEQLREQGFFVPAIRPPTVPKGQSCLRLSLTWSHTEEMLDGLIETLNKLHQKP